LILDVEERAEKSLTSLKNTKFTHRSSDVSAGIFHRHVYTIVMKITEVVWYECGLDMLVSDKKQWKQ